MRTRYLHRPAPLNVARVAATLYRDDDPAEPIADVYDPRAVLHLAAAPRLCRAVLHLPRRPGRMRPAPRARYGPHLYAHRAARCWPYHVSR